MRILLLAIVLVGAPFMIADTKPEPSEKNAARPSFFVLADDSGHFDYVSAGHTPTLLRRADDTVRETTSNSLPIGMFEETSYTVDRDLLSDGELMLLATDGLFELTNEDDEMLGADGVQEFLLAKRYRGTAETTDALYRFCGGYRDLSKLDDDLSFVAARLSDDSR